MDGVTATFAISMFVTVFSIVDPFAAAPIFIAITPNDTDPERRRMARLASIIACFILLLFAFAGNRIFTFFGISMAAFRVAGGILLLVVALDMLRARESTTKNSPEEKQEGAEKADVSITPLAVPLLAGPGAISTVALLGSQARGWPQMLTLFGAVLLTSLVTWGILANSTRVVNRIGRIGVRIVTRIMGLLLAGIGAQFILAGTKEFWNAPN